MTYGIIYLITNKINGKQYVGQTIRPLEERFANHKTGRAYMHITNAMKKHGPENFICEEVCKCSSHEELNDKEVFYVKHFDTLHPNGYNHRAGGNQRGIVSDELKRKISIAKTGKPNLKRRGEIRTEEQRIKIARGLGGKPILAVHRETGETKLYQTAHSAARDGHNPSNVVSICKKNSYRTHSKEWVFSYVNNVNQSGSSETKEMEHAQRIDLEPTKVE